MRRLGVFLVLVGTLVWTPWPWPAPEGEVAPGTIATAPVAVPVPPQRLALPRPPTPTPSTVARPASSPVRPGPAPVGASFEPVRLVAPPPPPLRPRPKHPVLADDFPDPDVIRVGTTWWAYATGTGFEHLQLRASADLITWGPPSDPLPQLPAWAVPGYSWAPAAQPTTTGFLLYYSARDAMYGRQCLSVAFSPTPAGPFVDSSTGPLTCQTGVGGSIDPETVTGSDGAAYLVWKSEENALGLASEIGAQRLASDGLHLVGPRPRLLTATAPWQAGVIEGPSMIAAGGWYYLFYGAGHWDTSGAGLGYAVCASPMGPCADESRANPWLASAPGMLGPSGPDVFVGPDGMAWLAYHAWNAVPVAGEHGPFDRQLWIVSVTFASGVPVIG